MLMEELFLPSQRRLLSDCWDLEWKPFSAIVLSVETWGLLQLTTRALAGSDHQKPFDRWKGKFWAALFTTAFFCKLEACIHEQSCIVGVVVHQSFHSSHFVAKVGWQRRASLLWWWIQRVERFSLGTCHELWYLTFFEAAQCPTAREISAESYEQLSSCGLRLRLPPSPSRFRSESWGLRVDVIWSKQRTCGIELNANFIDFYQVWTQRLFLSCPLNHKQTHNQKKASTGRTGHAFAASLRLSVTTDRAVYAWELGVSRQLHRGWMVPLGATRGSWRCTGLDGSHCFHWFQLCRKARPGAIEKPPTKETSIIIHSNYSWQLERYKSFKYSARDFFWGCPCRNIIVLLSQIPLGSERLMALLPLHHAWPYRQHVFAYKWLGWCFNSFGDALGSCQMLRGCWSCRELVVSCTRKYAKLAGLPLVALMIIVLYGCIMLHKSIL